MSQDDKLRQELDPLCVSALLEFKGILIAWAVNFIWTIGFCLAAGYDVDETQISLVFGMPSWVFWGVMLPWFVVSVYSIWFALTQIADHSLEPTESGDSSHD